MTANFYHGRKVKLIFGVILAGILFEFFLYLIRIIFENEDLGKALDGDDYLEDTNFTAKVFSVICNILVYLEYNLICLFGLIDLAKIEQLNSNKNVIGLIVCLQMLS